jgi:Haem-NO-binding
MHGRIFWQFREYVEKTHGARAWVAVLKGAGLQDRAYLAQPYPDSEAVSLIAATATITQKPIPVVVQEFGEFSVPALLQMYAHLIKPEWRTLDVIEHTEKVAHGAVRREQPGAAPPYLRTRRVSPRQLVLNYNSPRKLCAMAVGVGLGLGKYFQEKITVRHGACMHLGDDHCEITYEAV